MSSFSISESSRRRSSPTASTSRRWPALSSLSPTSRQRCAVQPNKSLRRRRWYSNTSPWALTSLTTGLVGARALPTDIKSSVSAGSCPRTSAARAAGASATVVAGLPLRPGLGVKARQSPIPTTRPVLKNPTDPTRPRHFGGARFRVEDLGIKLGLQPGREPGPGLVEGALDQVLLAAVEEMKSHDRSLGTTTRNAPRHR